MVRGDWRVPRFLTPGYNPVTLGCSPGLSFNWIRQIFKGKPIWKYSPPQTWEFLFQLFRGTEEIKGVAQKNKARGAEIMNLWKIRILQAEILCVQFKYYCTVDCEVDYTVKKVSDYPVSSRDVTKQTLPGREKFNHSRPARVWLVTPGLGMGKSLTFF